MFHLFFILFLFISASFLALMEIQIEGKYGWAEKLPTWKKYNKGMGISKLFYDPNQPITGYHFYLSLFLFTLIHFIFLFIPWTFRKEILIISFYILLTTIEDFLWILYNPDYGLKKFNKQSIKWQTNWFLGLPLPYWPKVPLGIILYLIGSGVL